MQADQPVLLICVHGYLQEVSSGLQQLLSCVARSSQSSQAVAQQAIVGLTRMAGQHTLVLYYTILKPHSRLALQHTGSITCVCAVLFCPALTSQKKSPWRLCLSCVTVCRNSSTVSSSSSHHHGNRSVCAIVLKCHYLICVSSNRCTTPSSCIKTTKQLCAVAACAVQLQASHKQQRLHVCSCRLY